MSAPKFEALKQYYPAAQAVHEGGVLCAFLPALRIDTPVGAVRLDALLYPAQHAGYESRLFLERQISAVNAKNWNSYQLIGRNWQACSWQGVSAALPWDQMLANHLRAFA